MEEKISNVSAAVRKISDVTREKRQIGEDSVYQGDKNEMSWLNGTNPSPALSPFPPQKKTN